MHIYALSMKSTAKKRDFNNGDIQFYFVGVDRIIQKRETVKMG